VCTDPHQTGFVGKDSDDSGRHIKSIGGGWGEGGPVAGGHGERGNRYNGGLGACPKRGPGAEPLVVALGVKKFVLFSGNPTDPSCSPPTLRMFWTYLL